MKPVIAFTACLLTACASGSGWSASSWSGLPDRTVAGGGYSFFASPVEGQGFKLKFAVKTDGLFGVAGAESVEDDALTDAARAATPEGCVFVSLDRTEDGGAVADYDCE